MVAERGGLRLVVEPRIRQAGGAPADPVPECPEHELTLRGSGPSVRVNEEEATVDENRRPDDIRRGAEPNERVSHDTTQTFGHDSDLSFIPFGSELSEVEREAIAALPSRSAMLLVRSGPTAGARYLLDTDVTTVGRHPEADIFFDDVTVSRRHAELNRSGTVFELVDQRSLNGTYVNGERVDRAVLTDGAELRIGKFRLNFFASPADREHAG
jgi:hypothetical protein